LLISKSLMGSQIINNMNVSGALFFPQNPPGGDFISTIFNSSFGRPGSE
jgi:hypothetical protein